MNKLNKTIIASIIIGTGLYLFARNFFIEPMRQEQSRYYSPAVTILSSASQKSPIEFLAKLSNAEVVVPGVLSQNDPEGLVRVKLENNSAKFFDGRSYGTISLNGILKTQKTDAGVDVFCDLAVSYGDSHNFYFISLFKLSDHDLINTSALAVENGVKILAIDPSSVVGNNYEVKIEYPNQVDSGLTFFVKNHKIVK